MHNRIDLMLEQYELEEIFYEMGIDPREVIDLLLEHGYELPEYIRNRPFDWETGYGED